MKVSIITAVYNRAATIGHTLESLNAQDYPHIEHIIIDGASTDNTLEVIETKKAKDAVVLSEPDKGVFEALNKGLKLATGDIVGFLHSDDFYANNSIISKIVTALQKNEVDAVFGDVAFVANHDLKKIVRYYSSKEFHPDQFQSGYMPAHPTFFTKRTFYEQFGNFKTDYVIASDFELLIRFLYVHRLSYQYIDQLMIYMRTGGLSNASIKSRYILNMEIIRACRENGIKTNSFKMLLKLFRKIPEFVMGKSARQA